MRRTRCRCSKVGGGSEILAYVALGLGYGFLPALWRNEASPGVAFVASSLENRAKVAVYSLAHVAPWMARVREALSEAAVEVLKRTFEVTSPRRAR